jgi:hypothetical protein
VLKGRVDGLEAKVGELEANQFSTTTKLKGQATFVIGANSYGGNRRVIGPNLANDFGIPNSFNPKWANLAAQQQGATAFNYDLRIDFDTSFTGKDLLRTRLRAGNFGTSPFGIGGPNSQSIVGLNALEVGFEGGPGADTVMVNRLFYQFPIGSSFTATVGGRVRQDDMLAVWPSVYPADTVLDIFTYAGAPGAYSLNLGSGGGLWWKSGGFSISANYVAANGNTGNPTSTNGVQCGRPIIDGNGNVIFGNGGGIGNDCSQQTGTAQIAYTGTNFSIAAAYTYSTPNGAAGLYSGNGTPLAVGAFLGANSVNSFAVSGYWQPSNSGWIPSISTGWGINSYTYGNGTGVLGQEFGGTESQSWYVGLQWTDVFIKGNAAGMALGQPTFLTSANKKAVIFDKANDGQYAWEWWYKFQVTDNISVTPAIYYLSAPLGQAQRGDGGGDFNNFGGLLKTTFKF